MHELDTALILAVALSLVVWGLASARLESLDVSAPMAFVVIGFVLTSEPLSVIDVNVRSETLRGLAEVTLALLLFFDAARVNLRVLSRDAGVPVRLLFGGLPLTVAFGTGIAVLLFPDLDPWLAAAIAAAVAPTDAALGAQVVEDTNVPARIRRVLNVESGLNDGIAAPFVTFFLAGAVAETVAGSATSLGGALSDALKDLGIGVLAGIAIGLGGGLLVKLSARRGWGLPTYRGIVALALAVSAYALAVELGGNGFIGAFVGGLALGTALPDRGERQPLEFDAQVGELLSLIVWFLFGAAVLPALDATTWQTVLFAVLALTIVRMVPVALVLVGAGLRPITVAFIGWFGPRGLASIVFGLIVFDALEGPDAEAALAVVALTVLLSVVAHGVTARPFSRRYGAHIAALSQTTNERAPVPALAARARSSSARTRRSTVTELEE